MFDECSTRTLIRRQALDENLQLRDEENPELAVAREAEAMLAAA